MRLYMIRHGQTYANRDKFYYGEEDIPLTPLGEEQAKSIRPVLERIPFDKVYSSDLLRAIQTQRLALPGIEGEREPLLREIEAGDLGGKPHSYFYDRQDQYDGWTPGKDQRGYSPVGGESMDDVGNRLKQFLATLEDKPYKNVAAFVHNGVLGCMLRLVLGATDFKRNAAYSANCAVHVFEYDGKMWKLVSWNYMVPLNGEEIK